MRPAIAADPCVSMTRRRSLEPLDERGREPHAMEITGLDHVYLTVEDFSVSQRFYDGVMRALGFRKGDRPIAGEPHAHYFNRALQCTIRPARPGGPRHDPRSPGLHHLCFQASSRADVNAAYEALRGLEVEATPPREYPEYNDDYYATFFEDPDGLRLEIVARSKHREKIAERWDDLEVFLNPIADLERRESE